MAWCKKGFRPVMKNILYLTNQESYLVPGEEMKLLLFEPVKLGNLTLNRICMAIHHCYTADGFINDRLRSITRPGLRQGSLDYHRRLLRRSAGEKCDDDRPHDDQFIPGLRKLRRHSRRRALARPSFIMAAAMLTRR